ncbi:hypothetical protein JOF57_006185 [Mycolicibacterium lutetiense]|uniref:Uncharacterized protein n=1 Tax=Mycolicibacterium lutetiense TaxID=1641992 RepID=A0ABS5A371_9MYCO|nr:hypothetical protein [Mycolicibacterium lutetiense]
MKPDYVPRRRPRPIWPAIGAIAAFARTLLDVWRFFHDS